MSGQNLAEISQEAIMSYARRPTCPRCHHAPVICGTCDRIMRGERKYHHHWHGVIRKRKRYRLCQLCLFTEGVRLGQAYVEVGK